MAYQDGPWAKYGGQSAPAPAPIAPTVPDRIYGAPKPVDPVDSRRLQLAEEEAARARAKAPIDLANAQAQPETRAFEQAAKLRDDYNASPNVKRYNEALTGYMSGLTSEPTPAGDLNLIYGFAKLMDPNSVVREGEQAAVAGGDTIAGQWQAKLEKELLQQGGTFTPAYRKQLREEMRRRGAALNQQFIAERVRYKQMAERAGIDPLDVVGEHPGLRFQDQEEQALGVTARNYDYNGNPLPDGPAAPAADKPNRPGEAFSLEGFIDRASGLRPVSWEPAGPGGQVRLRYADGHTEDVEVRDEAFLNSEEYRAAYAEKFGEDPGLSVFVRGGSDAPPPPPAPLPNRNGSGLDAIGRGIADTGTAGMADEIAAGLNTLFIGGTMKDNLRKERAIDEADTKQNFSQRLGGQIVGGFLNPIGRGATTPGEMARAGAVGGGLYGAGSGTDLASRGKNALLGAGGGAIGGYAVSKGLNALAPVAQRVFNSPARQAARAEREAVSENALKVIAAGEAENVPVSRALLDPALENPVTGAQATLAGGPIVDRSLRATSQAIESGVKRLSGGGEALVPPVAGEKVTGAGVRFIQRSGAEAKRLYDRADELAGKVKVPPTQSLREVDNLIETLSETKGTNASELAFLNTLRDDLSNDLSVGALRRIRTSLRKKISRGELVFGEDEARVLGIMDSASADITAGLQAAGRGEAAEAFSVADGFYRKRMEFIQGTVQKLIGKRGANLNPEQVFSKFQAMASPKGDGAGFGRMMRLLDPEEQADIAATFADALGKNNKGEFSTSHLLSQVQKLPASARRDLFGEEGAASLDNLLALAREHSRVSGKLNHSRSGVAGLARDYRSWLSGMLGVGAMAATQDVRGMAAGAIAGGLTAGKDALTAKALMSRDVSKWLRQAPRTTDPAAIDAHMKKLAAIGARNPMLADAVATIERRIAEAVAQLPPKAAADQGQEPKKP